MQIILFSLIEKTILYCPSTDEVILSHGQDNVNDPAEAFIANWSNEPSAKPVIKDVTFKAAWEQFLDKQFKKEPLSDEMIIKFLRKYDESEWIVYKTEIETSNGLSEPVTKWYVVLSDSVINEE